MNCRHSLVTENEFFQATGLNSRSRRKFEELGFMKPIAMDGDEALYAPEDLELVLIMRKYAREHSLRDAYEKAVAEMNSQASQAA